MYVARGVALAFHGDPPSDDHEAAHADGNVANNRPGNLEWSTRLKISDNARHHGTLPVGSKNAMSRLVEAQILPIDPWHRRCPTSRDCVPWRFSDAGRPSVRRARPNLVIGEQPPVPELPPQDAQWRFQLVFRRFIGVFARPEHPLALFLDDLQWLDAATLDLLEDLLTQADVQHLLLIGAYRDTRSMPRIR